MQVENLQANPNFQGGRVDLSWINPDKENFADFEGIKVLRREFMYPTLEKFDSNLVIHADRGTPAGEAAAYSDSGLKPETVYYYAVIAFDTDENPAGIATVSAMTGGTYRIADDLYSLLPAIYRRYDTLNPPDNELLAPDDKNKGQLQRFLEIIGLPLDLLRSYAGGGRNFSEIDQLEGDLLPLLAGWIGWRTNFTLNFAKQRNQIKYAPHYYRTTGTAPNLQATLNRLTNWGVQVKEFVHNVFRSNNPAELSIWEQVRRGNNWQPSGAVTPDVAYEGKPATFTDADGRHWLFYHARRRVVVSEPGNVNSVARDHWHIHYKLHERGVWLASRTLIFAGVADKYPAAFQKNDGNIWLFRVTYPETGGQPVCQIDLSLIAAGKPAWPAQLRGTASGPFALADGQSVEIGLDVGITNITRKITFHHEHFTDIQNAEATEVAARLNSELPGIRVTVTESNRLEMISIESGQGVSLTIAASNAANLLGLPVGSAAGSNAAQARVTTGRTENFALQDKDTLSLSINGGPFSTVIFAAQNFDDIANATAVEVAAAINRQLPATAKVDNGRVSIISGLTGEGTAVVVDVNASSAAPALGLGAATSPITVGTHDTEPAALEDNNGNVWLFWSSRRAGGWRIWYSRFDGAQWGAARQLTTGNRADREPAVVFDPDAGRIWAFWSRKKENGLWNIFFRSTIRLDFDAHPAAIPEDNEDIWTAVIELTPIPAHFERKEPSAVVRQSNNLELFYSANRQNGWNIWMNALTPDPLPDDIQITTGQFNRRAPTLLKPDAQTLRLLFRSNQNTIRTSPLYSRAVTVDSRYTGSDTVDTRNPAKIGLRGRFNDELRYTHDTGKTEADRYARDTLGIYLIPDTDNQQLIIHNRNMMENELRRFLPIQVRAVLIIEQVFNETVYTYDDSAAVLPHLIREQMIDTILSDVYRGLEDDHQDRADFRWLRTWQAGQPPTDLPDLAVQPPALDSRLFMNHIIEGE